MVSMVTIPPSGKTLGPLALGGVGFAADQWSDERAGDMLATMAAAFQLGLNHFDTAADYGSGTSERLLGQFMTRRREQLFVASKASTDQMSAEVMLEQVNQSLARLQTDFIDLFYIHWPRKGRDLRPLMEGLEKARQQGKIIAIGVSNFNVEQIEQVAQVGRIDAHQLCYNLLWRFDEAEVIPYCRAHHISLVTYSSIAQGILGGKFPRQNPLEPGDTRAKTVHFDADVWPNVYDAVTQFKKVADDANRPLSHLAIRWVLNQPDINTAVVSARTLQQLRQNVAALDGDIPDSVFARLTEISDQVMKHIPNTGNVYRYYP